VARFGTNSSVGFENEGGPWAAPYCSVFVPLLSQSKADQPPVDKEGLGGFWLNFQFNNFAIFNPELRPSAFENYKIEKLKIVPEPLLTSPWKGEGFWVCDIDEKWKLRENQIQLCRVVYSFLGE
jgi:hypothetical protein